MITLRVEVAAESATLHNTLLLEAAFGLDGRSGELTVAEHQRLDPGRIVHPVKATWTGRRSDLMRGDVGLRSGDAVMSEAFFARLAGMRLAPHVDVTVACAKSDKWGVRLLGPAADHHWIAWSEPDDLTDGVDWERSTFVVRESPVPGRERAEVRRSLRDRAELEEVARAAMDRWAALDVVDLSFRDPELERLDMLFLPRLRVDAYFVSERLAAALLSPPRLSGFRIRRSDGSLVSSGSAR